MRSTVFNSSSSFPYGALISGAAAALSGLFGSKAQNDAIDKQIEAQALENKKTREHNLNLAKQQNQWNVEQWNREVQYNDPSAQMARFKAAGLNPNLIYGQTTTAPQLSGSLSAGAPSSPADMSALGNKRNGISSIFDAIKANPFMAEQLRGMKIENDLKHEDWLKQKRENSDESTANDALIEDYDEFIRDPIQYYYKMNGVYPRARVMQKLMGVAEDWKRAQSMSEQQRQLVFENGVNDKVFDDVVKRIQSEAKISEEKARNAFTLYCAQALGAQASADITKKQNDWFTPQQIVNMGSQLVSTFAEGFSTVYGAKLLKPMTTYTESWSPSNGYSYRTTHSYR